MKYCDQCGAQLNDNAKFCPSCGAKFAASVDNPQEIIPVNTKLSTPQTPQVDTTEYLNLCVLIEKDIYTQNQIINKLKKKVSSLAIRTEYETPRAPRYLSFSAFEKDDWTMFCAGATFGGIVGIWTGSILWGALIGGIILFLFSFLGRLSGVRSDNDEAERTYKYEMQTYNTLVEEDKKRVETELVQKRKLLATIDEMTARKKESEDTLKKLYDVDILFPKYRNMAAVCSLYEYFISKRFSTLTGPDGAYNHFELEVRFDKVIVQLDSVIAQLEQIKENQLMLYTAIKEGNRLTQRLVDEFIRQTAIAEKTAESTERAAYYSQVAANNAAACAQIEMANHIAIKDFTRKYQ